MYHYVKGQGWVIGPEYETLEGTIDGKPVRFEARMPEIGEYYTWVSSHDSAFLNGLQPKLSEFAWAWKGLSLEVLAKFDPSRSYADLTTTIFVTIVPI